MPEMESCIYTSPYVQYNLYKLTYTPSVHIILHALQKMRTPYTRTVQMYGGIRSICKYKLTKIYTDKFTVYGNKFGLSARVAYHILI